MWQPCYMLRPVTHQLPYDLTIVTVCRNALEVLPRCIASVQPIYRTPLKVEHLVVDGASTDGSVSYLWCQRHAGRITRFISEPDNGIYDAMNKAIGLARGKVLVFINADDEICPEAAISCCSPILNGEVQYVVASALCMDTDRQYELTPRMEDALWRQPYCHQAMYCSRSLLQKMGGFAAAEFPIGADTDLMRRLYAAQQPCVVVPQVAARFYTGGASSSPATSRDVYELMLKFADACRSEVKRSPLVVSKVVKHLRRYANKKMMTESTPELPAGEATRMVAFVERVTEPLSSMQRRMLQTILKLQCFWYAAKASCCRGRKLMATRLNQQISTLFANSL